MELTQLSVCLIVFLLNSGAVFAYQVENGAIGGSVYFYESVPIHANLVVSWTHNNTRVAVRLPSVSPVCFAVLSSPVLSSNGNIDRVIDGSHVSLHCNASSQNVTTYVFYRDGMYICFEPHVTCEDDNLYFQPITVSDSGNYTCTIENPVSSKTSNILPLSVSVPVSDVKLASSISGLVWPGLDSVSLTCSAYGTHVSYSWSLQGISLPPDPQYHLTENNQVLTIDPVSDKDNGTFTCTASNWIKKRISNKIILILASGVSNVKLTSNTLNDQTYIWVGEESVSLYCSAQGSDVRFIWKLKGGLLPHDTRYNFSWGDSPPHSSLLISPVSKKDLGEFTCDAFNKLSLKTSNALSLNLAWLPAEETIECYAVPAGTNIQLGCSWAAGWPAANVSLMFNEETKDGQHYVTKMVSIGDHFQGSSLTCFGDQLGRTSECTVKFVSPVAPEHNNDTIIKTNSGESLTLRVILEPGLPAVFTWYHNSESVLHTNQPVSVVSTSFNSSLYISNVTVEDAGTYECRASNIVGNQSFLFTIIFYKNGLSEGAIAGIVIGVLFGVILIGIAAGFFILKTKKSPSEMVYDNAEVIHPNVYERTMPAIEMEKNAATPESHYDHLAYQDKDVYSTVLPSQRT